MSRYQEDNIGLPILGTLRLTYALSIVVAIMMTAASISGLLFRSAFYPTADLARSFVPNDAANLLIGLPILLRCMWLASQRKLIGLLCWPGALLFVFYNYLIYTFAYILDMPPTWPLLLFLALAALSLNSCIRLVTKINGATIQAQFAGGSTDRVAAGVLAALGLLFFLRAAGVLANALTHGTLSSGAELGVSLADLLITPAWIAGGILLWQRRQFGYVVGPGLLFQANMLFVALILVLLIQQLVMTVPLAWTDVAVIAAMSLVCLVPFVRFVGNMTGAPALPPNTR